MKIFIDIDQSTNRVVGWGTSPISVNSIEIEVDEESDFLFNFGKYIYADEVLREDNDIHLRNVKEEKDRELNKACETAILEGFKHVINGVEYHFSFDVEAQLNFQGSERILSQGIVDKINWTVKKDGEYTRIPVDKQLMGELTLAILMHKDRNVSRYRDYLMPLVNKAERIEDVEKINWEYEENIELV